MGRRPTRARRACGLLLWFLTGLLAATGAGARPERIRAGYSYYSDEFVTVGLVRDIGAERNYEEVFQAYRYYEASYDDAGRVVIFREYRRGEPIRTEEYRYGAEGELLERVVREPGRPEERTTPGPAGSEPET